jgi:adenosine deaminase
MRELVERKKAAKPELANFQIPDSLDRIDDFFPLFKFIYQLTDDEESVRIATRNIINEFAKDNVKYLELRTTPRKNDETGMTKHSYLSAVTSVIQEARNDIIVKLIVSIDRRNNLDEAQEVVDLALAFRSQGVVGVDLCGDVKVGLFENLRPAFERAKQHGFPLTLHFNEIEENVSESSSLLSIQPDRLGHATFLDDYCRKTIYGQNIPVEICMTSNILCKTVKTFEEHHIKELLVDKHPFILCTDDKGVFFSESSNEYRIAAETFNLNEEELFTITLRSIDAIFAGDDIKQTLKQDFLNWRKEH